MAKTVRFSELGGPEVLRLEELPVREPGPGEVLLRVDAIGLNRAEALFRAGRYIEQPRALPSGLGYEGAGTVEAVGPDAGGYEAGDAVSVIPSFSQNDYPLYAERAVVPARALVRRPDGVDAVAGSAVWMPYLTAYGALVDVGGLRAGDAVVLTAASSSVGIAAIHTVNRLGARPIAVTRTAAKREALLKEGAAEVIVSEEENTADRILELTGGAGARFVFDAVAGPGVTELARATASGGTVFLYGMLDGRPTPYPGFELGMPALNLRTYTIREITGDAERMARGVEFVAAGLRDGTFRAVVDRVFPLDEIAAAHRYLESNAQVGKIVVQVAH